MHYKWQERLRNNKHQSQGEGRRGFWSEKQYKESSIVLIVFYFLRSVEDSQVLSITLYSPFMPKIFQNIFFKQLNSLWDITEYVQELRLFNWNVNITGSGDIWRFIKYRLSMCYSWLILFSPGTHWISFGPAI